MEKKCLIAKKNKLIKLCSGNINNLFVNSKFQECIPQQDIGTLFLPTGSIVATDPFCLSETEAFQKRVPPGNYKVVLHIHHIGDDSIVAFSEIRFSENFAVSFELALTKQQAMQHSTTPLTDTEYFGYGVDSGTGSFMDKSTCRMLETITDDSFFTQMDKIMYKSYIDTYSTVNLSLPNSNHNLVAFSSGYGDGFFPSFWGYDEKGILCNLITDFFTIDED